MNNETNTSNLSPNNLPKLTPKENAFVFHLYTDCLNSPTKAYKLAYDCKNSSEKTIYVEASRLMKNPKITLWREYYEKTLMNFQKEEIKYTRKDFFDDLDRIRSKTEDNQKTVSVALKAVELKAKSCGFLKEKVELSGSASVQMGEVKIDNQTLNFNIGGGVNGVNEQNNTTPQSDTNEADNELDNSRDVEHSAQNASDDYGVQ